MDIFDLQPHQVSRDMRGYSVLFYGDPKSGKTTIATKFPKHLLLAFEKGYAAIPGAMAMPINSWAEFKKALRDLKDPRAMEKYETILIDTADLAWDYCEKYVCANAQRSDGGFGVDAIGDIPYGKGYSILSKEFDDALRSIVQMNYGLVLISHATDKTFKDEQGQEYNKIVPTLSSRPRNIVSRLCDIIGYSRAVTDQTGKIVTKLFLRGTPRYEAGSRFKYTPDYIDFTYNDLVEAICSAIDKQAEEEGSTNFTDTRTNLYVDTSQNLNFDDLMTEFNSIVSALLESTTEEDFAANWQPRIVQITDRYLGKGQKVTNCSRDQVEALSLIIDEMRDLRS